MIYGTDSEERGRLQQELKAEEEKAKLFDTITAKERIAQELASRTEALSANLSSKEAELLERAQEIQNRERADQNRAMIVANRIVSRAERETWILVSVVWILCSVVGIFGQFLIWNGLDWWLNSASNLARGGLVILCTVLAAAFSLRWVPPGKVDLAAVISMRISKKIIARYIRRVEPIDEQARVVSAVHSIRLGDP